MSAADKIVQSIEKAEQHVVMEVAIRCWTDVLDVDRDNVFEFLATMGPKLKADFIAQVQAYAAEHG